MWKNEKCVLVCFFEGAIQEGVPEEITSSLEKEEVEASDWINRRTPEELAVEMLDFLKKEFPRDEDRSYMSSHYFWESKGVQESLLSYEARSKIQKAEFLANKEAEAERKRRLQREKDELPSLVGKCVDWARDSGLKKVTRSDVETFLMEKDVDLMQETERALWGMVNLKLKSRK
jgi:hypothetical protein